MSPRLLPELVRVPAEQLLGENVLQTDAGEKKKQNKRMKAASEETAARRGVTGYQSIMLVESAAEKPSVLKLISVAVQSARPAMTGKRDRFTHRPGGVGGGQKESVRAKTLTPGQGRTSPIQSDRYEREQQAREGCKLSGDRDQLEELVK